MCTMFAVSVVRGWEMFLSHTPWDGLVEEALVRLGTHVLGSTSTLRSTREPNPYFCPLKKQLNIQWALGHTATVGDNTRNLQGTD